jgi:hypothetical protein
MTPTLKEAKRLFDLGFAILWIKPKSKAPVKSKWTTGPRDNWETLKRTYKPGYNMGVRLGTPSKIGNNFLAVIDVDVKSTNPIHQREAEQAVRELFPALNDKSIQVMSGRGNGSSHFYILTEKPAAPLKLKVSAEKIKALMPSAPISQSQRDVLSEEDLNEGYRMRAAWEVAVMGEGQQVVLPPSTHPDTNRAYTWKMRVDEPSQLPVLLLEHKKKDAVRELTSTWEPEDYDLTFSSLPNDVIQLILYAETDDRSAALFKVAITMVREGLTDRQIMSVLTDTQYELGKVAFEHAKTGDRGRAANWIFNYTLKKARHEVRASLQFDDEVEVSLLSDEDAEKQNTDLLAPPDWRDMLERYGPKGINANRPKSTLKNLVLIFTNEVAPDVFIRNVFKNREMYGHSTPWGGVKGALLTDDDVNRIRLWLAKRYRFEPSKDAVHDVMSYLADQNSFDPVKDWLETLEWDGKRRLNTWLARNFEAKGDPEYLAQVFEKWTTAMVMRVYRPGAKFDWMPIFEGAQGMGKSSFGEILVGADFFLDKLPDLHDKDAALALQGIWLCEHGELSTLRKNEIEIFKAFTSRTIDKVRPPFGKRWIESPRRCVFFGTTNKDTYLSDDSGNRRFKPVIVGQLNFEALRVDREQLLAEAVFLYKNCFSSPMDLELSGSAKVVEAELHKLKTVEDEATFMAEELASFIQNEAKKEADQRFPLTKFKTSWLFDSSRGGPLSDRKADQRHFEFAAKALKSIGGKKRTIMGYSYWFFRSLPPSKNGENRKPKEIIMS